MKSRKADPKQWPTAPQAEAARRDAAGFLMDAPVIGASYVRLQAAAPSPASNAARIAAQENRSPDVREQHPAKAAPHGGRQ